MTKKEKRSLLILGLIVGAAILLDQTKKARERNSSPAGSISSLPENPRFEPSSYPPYRPQWMEWLPYPKY